jgi:magnesium transporter
VRERIRLSRGIVRSRGTAYLAYALLDVVTDNYYPLLQSLETRLESLDRRLLRGHLDLLEELYDLRHLCVDVERAIRGNRDALGSLLHLPAEFISKDVRTYLRDCHDHALGQEQQAHSLYDFAMSLRELHSASQTARMNEIIKVLTMVSAIFIPLSSFAGVYGIHSRPEAAGNTPERRTPGAHWLWWGALLLLARGMLLFFRSRGWFSLSGRRPRRRR